MVGFSLEVDYRPQGAQAAQRDMRSLAQSAQQTESAFQATSTRIQSSANAINSAFAATSSGLSVTRGIASAATAMNSMSVATAGFAAATALLDLGRLRNDFGNVASATEKVTRDIYGVATSTRVAASGWATLGNVIRANPLLTIATVISAAAAAFSLFSGETKKAAGAYEDLIKSVRRNSLEQEAAQSLGLGTSSYESSRLKLLFDGFVQSRGAGVGPTTIDEIADASGVGRTQIARLLAGQGNAQALQYLRTGAFTDTRPGGQFVGISEFSNNNIGGLQVSAEQQQQIFRFAYQQEQQRQLAPAPRGFAPGGSLIGFGIQGGLISQQLGQQQIEGAGFRAAEMRLESERADQREAARMQAQQDAQNRSLENMRALRAEAEAFGATISDAFFNVASGTATARQAIAALVSDLARAASRQAFAGLFGSVVGGTATQGRQNIGVGSDGGTGFP